VTLFLSAALLKLQFKFKKRVDVPGTVIGEHSSLGGVLKAPTYSQMVNIQSSAASCSKLGSGQGFNKRAEL